MALVKGELGTRSTAAHYTMVYGGLQGVHVALTAFDKKLATKASAARVDELVTDTNICYDKSVEACKAIEHLVTLGSISTVAGLEHELRAMTSRTKALEETLEKASQEQAIASIHQELKGGRVILGGHVLNGKDACVAFAREHMLGNLMYYCIPLLMDALCMSSEEVVYKSDMQSDEIHPTRMPRNPMQMDVVLSVNTIIPPILEGLKDGIRKLKFDFNAAQTYKEWLSHNSYGGTCRNLQGEVKQAFDWIKGAINMTIGSPQAKTVLTELHSECLMHL